MIKRFLFLSVSILISISCEKKDSDDFLTNGRWILDNGFLSTAKETLKFNSNGTYLIVSEVSLPRQVHTVTGNISGSYNRQDNQINFTSTILDIPDDSSTVTGIQFENLDGQPIGNFFGYILNGIWQNDSSLIDSIGSIRYSELIDSDIFQSGNTDIRTWEILSLTNDSLKVESNNIITKYFKQ